MSEWLEAKPARGRRWSVPFGGIRVGVNFVKRGVAKSSPSFAAQTTYPSGTSLSNLPHAGVEALSETPHSTFQLGCAPLRAAKDDWEAAIGQLSESAARQGPALCRNRIIVNPLHKGSPACRNPY